jgi:hypothetical protein
MQTFLQDLVRVQLIPITFLIGREITSIRQVFPGNFLEIYSGDISYTICDNRGFLPLHQTITQLELVFLNPGTITVVGINNTVHGTSISLDISFNNKYLTVVPVFQSRGLPIGLI